MVARPGVDPIGDGVARRLSIGPGRAIRAARLIIGRSVPLRDVVNRAATIQSPRPAGFSGGGTRLECKRATAQGAGLEEIFYIADRNSIAQAEDLLRQYGELAIDEAAARSQHYRGLGNAIRFCEWRQIERFLSVLTQDVAIGTIH